MCPRTASPAGPGSAGPAPDAAALELVAGGRPRRRRAGRERPGRRASTVVRSRIGRSETVVCVVGEFKQGKSALINALLGADVCPVDDDLATMAVTVVRHGDPTERDRPPARRRRRRSSRRSSRTTLAAWVTERGQPGQPARGRAVEVGLPHPFLERGITLVDTPGHRRAERRPCGGDAGVPAVGRRARVRDRRLGRAVRARARVPRQRRSTPARRSSSP